MNSDDKHGNDLTPAQRKALRARAHNLDPVVMIADKGLSGSVLAEIALALKSHELIKIRVQAEREARDAMLLEICARSGASPVQHIGKILVVYRENPDKAPPRPAPGSREAGALRAQKRPRKSRREAPEKRPPHVRPPKPRARPSVSASRLRPSRRGCRSITTTATRRRSWT